MALISNDNYLHTAATPSAFQDAVAKIAVSEEMMDLITAARNSGAMPNFDPVRLTPAKFIYRALLHSQQGEVVELLTNGVHVTPQGSVKQARHFLKKAKHDYNIYIRINAEDTVAEQVISAIEEGKVLLRSPRSYDYIPGDAQSALEGQIVENDDATDALLSELGISGPIEAKKRQSKKKKRSKASSEPEDFREAKIAPHRRKSLTIMQPDEYLATILRD